MLSRSSTYAMMLCALVLAVPATSRAQEALPFLTTAELRCQRLTNKATTLYLNNVFNARRDCYVEQMKGALPLANDCRAPIDEGTGLEDTDERLRSAQAKILSDIATTCLTVDLAVLGFPGTCEDPDGAPFTAFDLELCIRNASDEITDTLLGIENPEVEFVYELPQRNCQAAISRKSSKLFINEFTARANCSYKQLNRNILELDNVDCRAEAEREAPETRHTPTDDDIISAHNKVLRELANDCRSIDLQGIGFPNECPSGAGNVFPLFSLVECLFVSHHEELIGFLDTGNPLTTNCGNGFINDFETCDDGDNEWLPGEVCNAICIANVVCGSPLDNGEPTINDALYILRAAVGLETCADSLCDVDGNGIVNTSDVLLVLRLVVGLPGEFNCPDPIIPGDPPPPLPES
jgi:hypothetical protein